MPRSSIDKITQRLSSSEYNVSFDIFPELRINLTKGQWSEFIKFKAEAKKPHNTHQQLANQGSSKLSLLDLKFKREIAQEFKYNSEIIEDLSDIVKQERTTSKEDLQARELKCFQDPVKYIEQLIEERIYDLKSHYLQIPTDKFGENPINSNFRLVLETYYQESTDSIIEEHKNALPRNFRYFEEPYSVTPFEASLEYISNLCDKADRWIYSFFKDQNPFQLTHFGLLTLEKFYTCQITALQEDLKSRLLGSIKDEIKLKEVVQELKYQSRLTSLIIQRIEQNFLEENDFSAPYINMSKRGLNIQQ